MPIKKFDHVVNDCYNVLDDMDSRKVKYDIYQDGIQIEMNLKYHSKVRSVAISNGLIPYLTYYDILYIYSNGFVIQ